MSEHGVVTAATAATELADEGAAVDVPRAVDEVVVLDYGGQYSQLIARRVRECGVFSELLPHHVGAEEVARRKPKGLILSGGPASVYAEGAPKLDPQLLELGIPVLGICYGMQLLALRLGGRVEGAEVGEFGRSQLTVNDPGRLLAGLPAEQSCWMSHRDTVFAAPRGFRALASSTESPVAAFESEERGVYGIQFHPEVVHTPYGQEVLKRFLGDVCGCEMTWSAASIVEEQIARIRDQVGSGKVICGLSGGVDSSAVDVPRAVDEVVVLDYGGQYSQLIARRVRECGVFSELLPHHVGADEVRRRAPRGLILSGGPASVYAPGAPRLDPELLELGIPVLGICYGMQALVLTLGGRVEGAEVGEFGRSRLAVSEPGRLLAGTPAEQACWMSHRDTVYEAPPGFTALASSTESPVAAVEDVEQGLYGIQFHPEVVHTPYGQQVLTTFLEDVCGCARDWSPASIIDEQVAAIRAPSS